ncbi:MAG: hypothetical protein A2Z18_07140 [Armatimonadetes bacterium RBG_16_58_9]|nr:MAG: hypothetical protein A2Z18_07140 [Armatimonadetes bacterium RBG_16_58_9]
MDDSGHKSYVLATGGAGRSVLVCPALAGRVMGTSYDGEPGTFGGWIDVKAFQEGINDIWDNWGGEERYWLCPEGGQFGLMFESLPNTFDNYRVQDGINNQAYEVVDTSNQGDSLTMRAEFEMVNAARTRFRVRSTRRITALDESPCVLGSGDGVECVGFQSESMLTNIGSAPWTKDTGCLAHWHLGQFVLGPRVIAIVPYRQGPFADPPIRRDYFERFCIGGVMPENRHSVKDGVALFRADGKVRTKIGQNRSRALGILGSYNLDTDEIILMQYDFYPTLEYAASYWYEQPEPYNGDCISLSAEGPDKPGGPEGRCYELESMSPALLLERGQSFTFRTRTVHIRGPRRAMAGICRGHFGVEVAALEDFDRRSS